MTDSNGGATTPVMFDHCSKVYNAMLKASEEEFITTYQDEPNGREDDRVTVYTGHLTGLFQQLGIPNPYYTAVMKALKAMNCVEQFRRGGGAGLSKWILYKEPTEEGFMAYHGNKRPGRHAGQVAALEQRVNNQEERLQRVERFLASITAVKEST